MTQRKIVRTLATFCLVCLTTQIGFAAPQATTYHVATDGDDNDLGTLAEPWRTIQHASENVDPGDTVLVHGGVYNESVTISGSGTATNRITYRNYNDEIAILDGQNSRRIGFIIEGESYVTIDGFEIRNYQSVADWELAAGIDVRDGSEGIELLNNRIHSIRPNPNKTDRIIANGIGVYGTSPTAPISDLVIDGNELFNLKLGWSESLVLNGNVAGFTISNNVIHDNDNIGIDIIGGEQFIEDDGVPANLNAARDGTIVANHVYNIDSATNPVYQGDRSAAGIYVDGGRNVVIERNHVHNNNFGFSVGSENAGRTSSGVTLRNNFVYRNLKAGIIMGGSDATANGGATNNAFINNTIFENGIGAEDSGELWIQNNVSNSAIQNNIFYADGDNVLINNWANSPTGMTVDHNIYYTPAGAVTSSWSWNDNYVEGFAAFKAATGFDANSQFVDPQLVSTVTPDLHIQAGSPAEDAGLGGLASGSADFDNEIRLVGTIDIGADEIQRAVTAVQMSKQLALASEQRLLVAVGLLLAGTLVGFRPNYLY